MSTPHIIIHMEGGIVQSVISPFPLHYTEIDYTDLESIDQEDLCDIPQGDGTTERAWFIAQSAEVNPQRVEEIIKATQTPCNQSTQ